MLHPHMYVHTQLQVPCRVGTKTVFEYIWNCQNYILMWPYAKMQQINYVLPSSSVIVTDPLEGLPE